MQSAKARQKFCGYLTYLLVGIIIRGIFLRHHGETNERRGGETEESVSEFYCLVPFDKYDLDDLLQPYGKKVKTVKGTIRQKYLDDHQ